LLAPVVRVSCRVESVHARLAAVARRSKEFEILVLRHELAMLRRQARQPKLTRVDRGLPAALSRSLPRAAWAGFPVKPATLAHRALRFSRPRIRRPGGAFVYQARELSGFDLAAVPVQPPGQASP